MTNPPPKLDNQRLPFLTLSLGSQRYALPIEQVVEVAAMVELVKVPDTPPEFLGAANRHGAVLPMLDLRLIFQQTACEITASTLFIVAVHDGQHIGLVVDEVYQVEYLSVEQVSGAAGREKYVQGIVPHHDQLVQIIALSALIAKSLPDAALF